MRCGIHICFYNDNYECFKKNLTTCDFVNLANRNIAEKPIQFGDDDKLCCAVHLVMKI